MTLEIESFAAERDAVRAARRVTLRRIDGLLLMVEEANLHDQEVPRRVVRDIEALGVRVTPWSTGADLIEELFGVQEHYVRHPLVRLVQAVETPVSRSQRYADFVRNL